MDLTWRVKILEQSGSPLILCFGKTFAMEQGCPRGRDCTMCKNDCVGCTARGVVYTATCTACKEDSVERGIYVGETRVYEHMSALKNWSMKSFQLAHWMLHHSTDTSPPRFKFKVASNTVSNTQKITMRDQLLVNSSSVESLSSTISEEHFVMF